MKTIQNYWLFFSIIVVTVVLGFFAVYPPAKTEVVSISRTNLARYQLQVRSPATKSTSGVKVIGGSASYEERDGGWVQVWYPLTNP